MAFVGRWTVRILAGIGALFIVVIVVAVIIGDSDEADEPAEVAGDVATPTVAEATIIPATPTLTEAGRAYVAAVATKQADATREARIHADQTKEARPTRTPRPVHYDLKLISRSCTWAYGYATVEGFVENVSGKRLENIEAVSIWATEEGTPISSDSALIEYDPLLPGQSSPYEVMDRYNPAMKRCTVEFKEFFGGKLKTDYSAAQ